MSRTTLPYRVECMSSYPFFEVIAAFNVESVAIGYAKDCATTNPGNYYKVTTKGGKVLATNEYDEFEVYTSGK